MDKETTTRERAKTYREEMTNIDRIKVAANREITNWQTRRDAFLQFVGGWARLPPVYYGDPTQTCYWRKCDSENRFYSTEEAWEALKKEFEAEIAKASPPDEPEAPEESTDSVEGRDVAELLAQVTDAIALRDRMSRLTAMQRGARISPEDFRDQQVQVLLAAGWEPHSQCQDLWRSPDSGVKGYFDINDSWEQLEADLDRTVEQLLATLREKGKTLDRESE